MTKPICPFCKEGNLEVRERYPNAMLEMLKGRFLQCEKCGYKPTDKEVLAVLGRKKV